MTSMVPACNWARAMSAERAERMKGTTASAPAPQRRSGGLATRVFGAAAMSFPTWAYALFFFVIPVALVVFYSFGYKPDQFTAVATTIQGSGWAILAYEPIAGNLVIEQFYDQQNGVPVATIPLFQLDMWEHAFYLDYQNVKPDYVKAWWNIVNWEDAGARFDRAVNQTKGLLLG